MVPLTTAHAVALNPAGRRKSRDCSCRVKEFGRKFRLDTAKFLQSAVWLAAYDVATGRTQFDCVEFDVVRLRGPVQVATRDGEGASGSGVHTDRRHCLRGTSRSNVCAGVEYLRVRGEDARHRNAEIQRQVRLHVVVGMATPSVSDHRRTHEEIRRQGRVRHDRYVRGDRLCPDLA